MLKPEENESENNNKSENNNVRIIIDTNESTRNKTTIKRTIVLGGCILFIVLAMVIAIKIAYPYWIMIRDNKENGSNTSTDAETTTTLLKESLAKSADLTTAKLRYKGCSKYEDDGKIPFITKGGFILVYEADVWAGFDVNNITIESTDEQSFTVTIPKATITNVKVDPDTVHYYNQKFKLLNFTEKEDSVQALALAEDDITEQAKKSGIIELANEQSVTLIRGLLAEVISENDLKITIQQEE